MIFKATKDIESAIRANNWNCDVQEAKDGQSSAVITGFNLKCGKSIEVLFISAADNDAAVRSFDYYKIPAGKEHHALHLCNELNSQFRFVKFVCQDDHIIAEMDMPVETQNPGEVCVELLIRLLQISEDAIPALRSALEPTSPIITPGSSPNSERY